MAVSHNDRLRGSVIHVFGPRRHFCERDIHIKTIRLLSLNIMFVLRIISPPPASIPSSITHTPPAHTSYLRDLFSSVSS